jgi:hypothetical protein
MKLLSLSLTALLFATPGLAQNPDIQETASPEIYEIELNEVQTERADYFYNFGPTRINDRRSATFSIRNNNSIPVYINDINIEGDGFRARDNCPRLLFRGDRCTVLVTFRPFDTGQYRGTLDFDLTGTQDIRVNLRGRGVRGGY